LVASFVINPTLMVAAGLDVWAEATAVPMATRASAARATLPVMVLGVGISFLLIRVAWDRLRLVAHDPDDRRIIRSRQAVAQPLANGRLE
jgi:hypothetical protein